MKAFLRIVLLMQALLDLLIGAVMLVSPWATRLLEADFALPDAGVPGQLTGVLLLMAGGLCWRATVDGRLSVTVARLRGHANWANALVLLVWVFGLNLDAGPNGRVVLVGCAAVWALYAILELTLTARLRALEQEERMVAAQAIRKARRQSRQPQAVAEGDPIHDAMTTQLAAETVVWNGSEATQVQHTPPVGLTESGRPRSIWRRFLSFF